MTFVKSRDNEPGEVTHRRFKRNIEKDGAIQEMRRRERHEKESTKRKRRKDASRKRWLKKLSREAPQPRGAAEARVRERE